LKPAEKQDPGMTERLRGLSILIVEDEFFIAMQVANAIKCCGGSVVGPVADLEKARDLVERETVDGVILDLKLNGETSLPFADELMSRGTPVILATGYAQSHIPQRYCDLPRLMKPVRDAALVRLIERTFRR
jgi:two-component SAPR family response regulator